jgi:GTP-binding protein HflX
MRGERLRRHRPGVVALVQGGAQIGPCRSEDDLHALRGAGARVLVADTVGFLEDLPHTLLESFRSTLSEALDADLCLHVADASTSRLSEQLAVTRTVTKETDGATKPELLLLNKVDLISPERREELQAAFPDALLVSSQSEADRRQVVQRIRDQLAG